MKSLFAGLLLTASAGLATAQTAYLNPVCDPASASYKTSASASPITKTVIAGSSAMWVTMALGAYNQSVGIPGKIGRTHHYVSNGNFNLVDTRPKAFGAANPSITDSGQVWIVWDERTTFVSGTGTVCAPNVWIYMNTDSVVGNRAVFASIGGGGFGAYIETPAVVPPQGGSGITPALWGTVAPASPIDNVLPAQIAGIFTSANEGVPNAPNLVSVGATDIRPEDAFWATTRANSVLGAKPAPNNAPDLRDGLGYVSAAATGPNSTTSGASPANCTGLVQGATKDDLIGQTIQGQEVNSSGSKGSFNVVAFNITGQDPFSCATLPAAKVIPVGATPIVFIHSNNGATLSGLTNATSEQLGTAFSGGSSNASLFGLPPASFAIFVREPLSGTYNTTELSVMRHPSLLSKYRHSMETGVNPAVDNPLNGNGNRFRAIGTGREVNAVKNAAANHAMDGIGFTFFSYGNVAPLVTAPANPADYSYITLNGVDPIWHNYVPGTNGITDPGQNATPGRLPSVADLPVGCASGGGAVPCDEHQIWAADHSYNTVGVNTTILDSFSFPNLRNGGYQAWSVVRLVAAGAFANASALANASAVYAVTSTPDYVPFNTVKSGVNIIDPGLQVLRAHYGCTQETCGLNFLGTAVNPAFNFPERGRDAGGLILPKGDIKVNLTLDGVGFVFFQ